MSLNIYTAVKRPCAVTAVNITPENADAVAEFLGEGCFAYDRYVVSPNASAKRPTGTWKVVGVTIPGVGRALVGDWVIVDTDSTLRIYTPSEFMLMFNHLRGTPRPRYVEQA